jgi:hypothetical protein
LTAEDKAIWKETKKDRFGKVHDSFAVNGETFASKVQREAGKKRRLYVSLYGGLRYLSDNSSHGGDDNDDCMRGCCCGGGE